MHSAGSDLKFLIASFLYPSFFILYFQSVFGVASGNGLERGADAELPAAGTELPRHEPSGPTQLLPSYSSLPCSYPMAVDMGSRSERMAWLWEIIARYTRWYTIDNIRFSTGVDLPECYKIHLLLETHYILKLSIP